MYGHPRATKDIDIFIFKDKSNLEKLGKAFNEFGAPPVDINYLGEKGNIIRFGVPPIAIDIINDADGIDINDCYSRKETIMIDDVEIAIISKEDLIKNKKSTGRLSDLADAEKLEHINKKK